MLSDPVYRYDKGLGETQCECDTATGGGPSIHSGGSLQQQLAATLVSAFLGALMRGLEADPGPSGEAQRQALQQKWDEEEKERRAAEKRRRDAAFAGAKEGALALLGNRPATGAAVRPPEPVPQDGVYIGNGRIPALLRKAGAATEEEWASAKRWQSRIDELMRKRPLSAEEVRELAELEAKRNGLWKRTVAVPGLTGKDRDALRLPLFHDRSGGVDATAERLIQAREDLAQAGMDGGQVLLPEVATASMAYGLGAAVEQGGEAFVVRNLGERAIAFGDAYAIGGVAMAFAEGNKEAAAAPAINWVLGKLRLSALSVGTAQGVGQVTTTVVRTSWDRFVTEADKVVPGTLPAGGADAFWEEMKRDATSGQRVVFEWLGM